MANTTLKCLDLRCREQRKIPPKGIWTYKHQTDNEFSAETARALCEALKTNATLEELYVDSGQHSYSCLNRKQIEHQTDSNFGVEGARALSEALKVNTGLTTFCLSRSSQQILPQAQRLNMHKKADDKIQDLGASLLSEALEFNTTLTKLSIQCLSQQHRKQYCIESQYALILKKQNRYQHWLWWIRCAVQCARDQHHISNAKDQKWASQCRGFQTIR